MEGMPKNYERVLNEALSRKKLSPVRYECLRNRLMDVLNGKPSDEFAEWTCEQAKKLQEELDK